MVDICPFKAQERMNDVCKNNYFSPRTKQSYTKLSLTKIVLLWLDL